jgi:hypothetical protein
MSFIQNLFSSRDNNADGNTFVGQQDRIWWNPDTNAFYVNTANVAGGTPVTLAATANITINTLTANSGTFNGNLVVTGNISPAANNKIGGIAPGPGVEISDSGLLTINSAGLPISFGDFFANTNQLSVVNADEDMYLVSNGTGNINLIGGVNVYKPDGFPPSEQPIFSVSQDGQVQMLVPGADSAEGAVTIVGGLDGVFQPPLNTGVMLHITGIAGTPGVPSRLYNDAQNAFAAFVARRYNGTAASPTAVLADEEIMRLSGTAYNGNNIPGTANQRIVYKALGNQTLSNQGGAIELWATPLNSTTLAKVATIDTANGITSTTINSTGNITGGNLTTAGITSTGSLTASTTISATGNITGGNILTGGVVNATANITGGNLLTSGLISATGNITGGNVTATNYTGLVTHSIRNAGVVTGTTLTLNVITDDIVKCTFSDAFTVAFSNIIAGRTITLLATNTSAGDTDIITAGISAVNMQGDSTLTVTQQTTAVITYYSLDGDVGNIYASAVYA